MNETDIRFRDIPTAEATKEKNTIDIQNKIAENKKITSNKEIQTQLLKEFLQTPLLIQVYPSASILN